MTNVTHSINKEFYNKLLKSSGFSQNSLAKNLGEPPSTLSRWVNDGYPADRVRELAKALSAKGNDFRRLINAPVYDFYFKKKYLGEPSEHAVKRAIELAKLWLQSDEMKPAEAPFQDLSNADNHLTVASAIRSTFSLTKKIEFRSLCDSLRVKGIVVAPISFSFVGIVGKESEGRRDERECGVTITDNKLKYVILLDTDKHNAADLSYYLLHEICHIFRPQAKQDKDEERFCNNVASEVIFPDKDVLSMLSRPGSIRTKLHRIYEELGGSHIGILYMLSQRKHIEGADFGMNKKYAESLRGKNLGIAPEGNKLEDIRNFYEAINLDDAGAYVFKFLKDAVLNGEVSGRGLAEHLGIESSDGMLLAESWLKEAEG
ncbi:MAG: XRE family transcriptional regulator [Oligoflexus sp.]